MPTLLAFINIKFLTPITSIIFMALSSLICLAIEDTFVLLKLATLSEYLFIGGTIGGLLYLRKTHPHMLRPIKVTKISKDAEIEHIISFFCFNLCN